MGKVRAVRRARYESLTSIMRQSNGLVRALFTKKFALEDSTGPDVFFIAFCLESFAGFEHLQSFLQSFRILTLAPGNFNP